MDGKTQQLLQQLRDIHISSPISWWPLASGWWILLALLIIILISIITALLYKKHYQLNKIKYATIKQLNLIINSQADVKSKISQVSILLRKLVLTKVNRLNAAGLIGINWLEYLDQLKTVGEQNFFSQGMGRCLLTIPYQKNPIKIADNFSVDKFLTEIKQFVKQDL